MNHDIIIVGSGPTGVAAALGFADNKIVPLVLDVGYDPHSHPPLKEGFYDYRKSNDSFDIMIGKDYEGLHNLIHEKKIFPKLISPFMQYVVKDADRLSPVDEKGFIATQSFAKGGLANAWGAGLYRVLDDELQNIPLSASDLTPYYDRFTNEIGISGDEDDLTKFFGSTEGLLPPLKLSKKSSLLLSKYEKRKNSFNKKGIYIGRPRLCVLSKDYKNRQKCSYNNLESWFPHQPYIYTPAYTLNRLIEEKKIHYKRSILVKRWSREKDSVVVHAINSNDSSEIKFKCKKLILAAGTINSAKIVLNSKKDFNTELPLLDNGLVQIPLIFPRFVGSKHETDVLGLPNLDIVIESKQNGERLKGSIVELSFPLKSFFSEMLPFSAQDNLRFMKYFLQSLLVVLLYFPSSSINSGYIKLRSDDKLEVSSSPYYFDKGVLKDLTRAFNRVGIVTHTLMMEYAQPGYAIHYAGSLPMVESPFREYQCSKTGELYNEPDVHIVDGSLFSHIPAKNITFTFMANAMRIADHVSKKLG